MKHHNYQVVLNELNTYINEALSNTSKYDQCLKFVKGAYITDW